MKYIRFVIIGIIITITFSGCLKTFDVSPDGKQVVYIEPLSGKPRGGIFLYDLRSKQRTSIETGSRSMYFCTSFSPDGKKIAYIKLNDVVISHDKNNRQISKTAIGLWVSDLTGKVKYEVAPLLQKLPVDYWQNNGGYEMLYLLTLNWSPDSKEIVYTDIDQLYREVPKEESMKISIYKVNIDNKDIVQLTNEEDGVCQYPIYSPDGNEILYTKGFMMESPEGPLQSGIYAMDTVGLVKREIFRTVTKKEKKYILGPASWSPDGSNIAFALASQEWQGTKICLISKDGGEIKSLSPAGNWSDPKFSPDGKYLVWEKGFEQQASYYIMASDFTGNILGEYKDGYNAQWTKDSHGIIYLDAEQKAIVLSNLKEKTQEILIDEKSSRVSP